MMKKARMVLIEGLPGSGKTTAMRAVSECLAEQGTVSEAWPEDSLDHPTDFDGTAYLEAQAFEDLRRTCPALESLGPLVKPFREGYLVPYKKAMTAHHLLPDPELLEVLARHDVYELPPDRHVRVIQERWKDFAFIHQADRKVFLFECAFLQNPVTALMVRHGVSDAVTTGHVQELLRTVAPFDPVLIYIRQKDLRRSFLQAVKERPASWYEGFEAYYTHQGYGLSHGCQGTEGVLQVLEARAHLEKAILSTLSPPCHVVDNSGFHPSSLREALRKILVERGILKGL